MNQEQYDNYLKAKDYKKKHKQEFKMYKECKMKNEIGKANKHLANSKRFFELSKATF